LRVHRSATPRCRASVAGFRVNIQRRCWCRSHAHEPQVCGNSCSASSMMNTRFTYSLMRAMLASPRSKGARCGTYRSAMYSCLPSTRACTCATALRNHARHAYKFVVLFLLDLCAARQSAAARSRFHLLRILLTHHDRQGDVIGYLRIMYAGADRREIRPGFAQMQNDVSAAVGFSTVSSEYSLAVRVQRTPCSAPNRHGA